MDADLEQLTTNGYIASVILVIVSLLGGILNGWVGWLLYYSKKSTVHTSNVLFANLLFSDLVISILVFIAHCYHVATNRIWNFALCQTIGFTGQAFSGVSFTILVAQVIDPFRIVVLRCPPMTSKQLIFLLINIWVMMGIVVPVLPYILGDPYMHLQSNSWCYVDVYCEKLSCKILMIVSSISLSSVLMSTGIAYFLVWRYLPSKKVDDNLDNQNPSRGHAIDLHWRMAKQGMAVFSCLILFWFWPIVFIIMRITGRPQVSDWEDIIVGIMGVVSHISNASILLIVNDEVRKQAHQSFVSSFRKNEGGSGIRVSASTRFSDTTRQ